MFDDSKQDCEYLKSVETAFIYSQRLVRFSIFVGQSC